MPDEPTAADALFRILAIQLGRCPRYNHRVKSPRAIKAALPSFYVRVDAHPRGRSVVSDPEAAPRGSHGIWSHSGLHRRVLCGDLTYSVLSLKSELHQLQENRRRSDAGQN